MKQQQLERTLSDTLSTLRKALELMDKGGWTEAQDLLTTLELELGHVT